MVGSALAMCEEAAAIQRERATAEGSAGAFSGAMAVVVARVRAVVLRVRQRVAGGVAPTVWGAAVRALAAARQEIWPTVAADRCPHSDRSLCRQSCSHIRCMTIQQEA